MAGLSGPWRAYGRYWEWQCRIGAGRMYSLPCCCGYYGFSRWPPDLTAAGPQNVVNILAFWRSVGPPTSSEHQSSSFSRPRVALYVLSKPSPGAIDPVPENIQYQSILKGSRPKLSNSWCPSWRARRGPRWEAAACARSEAKRSNRPGYHMPSMARRRGGAGR